MELPAHLVEYYIERSGVSQAGVPDFLATVIKALGIDPTVQNISNISRPIRIVNAAARPIEEVLA
jgi:predicted transcriptional regulator